MAATTCDQLWKGRSWWCFSLSRYQGWHPPLESLRRGYLGGKHHRCSCPGDWRIAQQGFTQPFTQCFHALGVRESSVGASCVSMESSLAPKIGTRPVMLSSSKLSEVHTNDAQAPTREPESRFPFRQRRGEYKGKAIGMRLFCETLR